MEGRVRTGRTGARKQHAHLQALLTAQVGPTHAQNGTRPDSNAPCLVGFCAGKKSTSWASAWAGLVLAAVIRGGDGADRPTRPPPRTRWLACPHTGSTGRRSPTDRRGPPPPAPATGGMNAMVGVAAGCTEAGRTRTVMNTSKGEGDGKKTTRGRAGRAGRQPH